MFSVRRVFVVTCEVTETNMMSHHNPVKSGLGMPGWSGISEDGRDDSLTTSRHLADSEYGEKLDERSECCERSQTR